AGSVRRGPREFAPAGSGARLQDADAPALPGAPRALHDPGQSGDHRVRPVQYTLQAHAPGLRSGWPPWDRIPILSPSRQDWNPIPRCHDPDRIGILSHGGKPLLSAQSAPVGSRLSNMFPPHTEKPNQGILLSPGQTGPAATNSSSIQGGVLQAVKQILKG